MSGQNNTGVLMGRTQNVGANHPGGMNPNQPQQNPLQQLAALSTRFAGTKNSAGSSMASLYSYGSSRTNYAGILGLDEVLNEEQQKQQALVESGTVAGQIMNICVQRRQGTPFYATWKAALERFKSPRKNVPQDQGLVDFVNEVESNQNLHNFIIINATIQFAAEYGHHLAAGDESIRDRNKMQDIFYRCAIDTINLQCIDFLANSPNGAQMFQRMSTDAKNTLIQNENQCYEAAIQKYTFAGQECPFRKGQLQGMNERVAVNNPILNPSNPNDLGMGGNIFEYNLSSFGQQQAAGEDQSVRDFREFIESRANGYTRSTVPSDTNYYRDPELIQCSYDTYDRPQLKLEDITNENRHSYNLLDYATNIPNTEWYVVRPEHMVYLAKSMKTDDGIPFRIRDTRCLGTVPVYRFDWQQGTFNFRLIKHTLQTWDLMQTLISNPEKLLPFMYEEDGIQKTTFDPLALETDKFVRDGVVVPMEEMKELKKQPDLLIGNKPMKANQGNEHTVTRLNVLTQTYDPKGKLDAFVLPMVITREWNMEPTVNMTRFYEQFQVMTHGSSMGISDTGRVLRLIRQSWNECESEEFKEFLEPYLTNLVNRWLVECRGYAETKNEQAGIPYLRVGNIFEDLEDLINHLKDYDHPTMRAFLDFSHNAFLRSGIEVLATREMVKAEYEEKYKSEEDEVTRSIMIKSGERAIVIKRNTVFINLIQLQGPVHLDAVIIKESGNPELFAIVRKAIEVGRRHFDDVPQVLVKFHKDDTNKVWVLTPSEYDPGSVFVLRTISEGQAYCHPYPVCE